MNSQAPFLHVVSASLPKELSKDLIALCSSPSSEALLDNVIRFLCGAECASGQFREDTEAHWASQQALVRQKLSELSSKKRQRDADEQDESSKRQKIYSSSAGAADPPKFTLPSISVTSPVRKKVNLVIHQSSIRFINPTSEALEATVPLSSIRRVFLLPTRGKTKPHWTVVLMSNDIPDKAKTPASEASHQIIFGLDATTNSALTTTSHHDPSSSSKDDATISLTKGDETLPVLKQFLSYIPLPIFQPSIEKFKSAITTGTGSSPGVEANRNAKSGTLWFLPQGILWGESKPCEFWAVEDLANNSDGVRMISATGRVCSVILTRRSLDDEELGEETAFGQIDGKEQDGIGQWVRNYRHLFGGKGNSTTKASSSRTNHTGHTPPPAPKPSGPLTINKMIVDSDDEDADFKLADSEDDGEGSDSASNDGSDNDGSGEDDDVDGSDVDAEGEDEEEEEGLKPENHPLLRPGAMPKMSRAAVDMVVGMMEQDLVGGPEEGDDEDELDD